MIFQIVFPHWNGELGATKCFLLYLIWVNGLAFWYLVLLAWQFLAIRRPMRIYLEDILTGAATFDRLSVPNSALFIRPRDKGSWSNLGQPLSADLTELKLDAINSRVLLDVNAGRNRAWFLKQLAILTVLITLTQVSCTADETFHPFFCCNSVITGSQAMLITEDLLLSRIVWGFLTAIVAMIVTVFTR